MLGLKYFVALYDFSGSTACSAYLSLKLKYGFFLPVSSPRNVSFPVALYSLPLSEAQGSPDCSLSLPSILVVSDEKTGSFTNSAGILLQ